MKKKKFYLSHLILSLLLICFGAGFGYFIISTLFISVEPFTFVALLLYIPTLLLGSVLPLYGGISYLISILKGEDGPMYPPPDKNTSDILDQLAKKNQE